MSGRYSGQKAASIRGRASGGEANFALAMEPRLSRRPGPSRGDPCRRTIRPKPTCQPMQCPVSSCMVIILARRAGFEPLRRSSFTVRAAGPRSPSRRSAGSCGGRDDRGQNPCRHCAHLRSPVRRPYPVGGLWSTLDLEGNPWPHPFLCRARKALAQPGLASCRPRATASASGSTFLVTTEPDPT